MKRIVIIFTIILSWVLFVPVFGQDTQPPEIEIWYVFQTGDLTFHVVAKITDNESGIDPSTVEVKYRRIGSIYPTKSDDFVEYINYPGFWEAHADFEYDEGDQIVWRVEATDNAGNTFHYPEDLDPYLYWNIVDVDPDFEEYCARIIIHDEDHLDDPNTFHYDISYENGQNGAFSFKQIDNEIRIYNNTAIWYSMDVLQPELYPLEGYRFLGLSDYMPEPKSGLIPLSVSSIWGDRSVKIPDISDVDQININFDRKSYHAIIRNVWDMVFITLKPKFSHIDDELLLDAIEQVSEDIGIIEDLENEPDQSYTNLALKAIDEILAQSTINLLSHAIATIEVNFYNFLSYETAFEGASKVISGLFSTIQGINNRALFVIDVFRYPYDQESMRLVKQSPLKFDETSVPGNIQSGNTDYINVNDTSSISLVVIVPPGAQEPFFKGFPEVKIYDQMGNVIDSSFLPQYGYNSTGNINLEFISLWDNTVGTMFNPVRFNNSIGIKIIDYPFTTSVTGHNYQSSFRPYFMEVLLYQNGLPGIGVNPINADTLISTGKIPFRLMDDINPIQPIIDGPSNYCSELNYAFVILDSLEIDIGHYEVYRKLYNESEFVKLVDTVPSTGKKFVYFQETFDLPVDFVSYKIKAVDISGNIGEFSEEITIDPLPLSGIFLTASSYSANLFDPIEITAQAKNDQNDPIVGLLLNFSSDHSASFVGDNGSSSYTDSIGFANITFYPAEAGNHQISCADLFGSSGQLNDPILVNDTLIGGQGKIVGYQYWFDGNITEIENKPVNPTDNLILNQNIYINELDQGIHTLHIRVKDSQNQWSQTLNYTFYKRDLISGIDVKMVGYEYWFDNNPATKTYTYAGSQESIHLISSFAIDQLSVGIHRFHIRFKDSNGKWSNSMNYFFYKVEDPGIVPNYITAYKYWFDNNTSTPVEIQVNNSSNSFNLFTYIPIDSLGQGIHRFHIKFKDANDNWSGTLSYFFYKPVSSVVPNKITAYRYWFNNKINQLQTEQLAEPVNPLYLITNIPIPNLPDGSHTFHIQFQDENGKWSSDISESFTYTAGSFISLKVFLEGPFNLTEMTTELNDNAFLPNQQPFNTEPWNYNDMGFGSVATIPNPDVVDWVLIEIRKSLSGASNATSDSTLIQRAGFILKDGSIVSTDGSSPISFNIESSDSLYAVVWHRNHLGIMSSESLPETGGTFTYDFTDDPQKVYGGTLGCKELEAGIWGLVAGDGNSDGAVNILDYYEIWKLQAGKSGYESGDVNMNGQVDNIDKNDVLLPNEEKGSLVPE